MRQGFTLFELAMTFVVVGLVVALGAKLTTEQTGTACLDKTAAQLATIQQALDQFVAQNDRLPMPALRTLGNEDPQFGREAVGGLDTDPGNTVTFGALPFQALGLSQMYAGDCWGHKFTYAVTTALTSSNVVGGYRDPAVHGAITIRRDSSNTLNPAGAYAVVSHGENGVGSVATNYRGILKHWCNPGAEIERENCEISNATLVATTYNDGKDSGGQRFDDLVVFKGKVAVATPCSATTLGWLTSCNASTPASTADGATITLTNTAAGFTGTTQATCTAGSFTVTGPSTCNPSSCPAQIVNWLSNCGVWVPGAAEAATVSLDNQVLGYSGTATATCNAGTFNVSVPVCKPKVAYCWGQGNSGRLGNGVAVGVYDTPQPVTLAPGITFAQITTGADAHFSCATTGGGEGYCWGRGSSGELGNGSTSDRTVPTPVSMPIGVQFARIAAGTNHVCALDTLGDAYCWGEGGVGRLGNGATIDRTTPWPVTMPAGGIKFVQIALGEASTCAIGTDGNAYCWGRGASGQLGNGGTGSSSIPVAVMMPPGKQFTQAAVGDEHVCAVANDGTAYCWGLAINGRLGNANDGITPGPSNFSTPQLVANPAGISFVSIAANFYGSCAIDTQGDAYCWGNNAIDVLGTGVSSPTNTTPLPVVMPGEKFLQLSMGRLHSCATSTSKTTYCWGMGTTGILGNGTSSNQPTPSAVSMPSGILFSDVGAGYYHSCALAE